MKETTIETLFERMEQRGTGAYGLSDVTQLEHALQCAELARQNGMGDKLIIAALFHDVGHMFVDSDVDLASQGIDDRHEHASAGLLEPLFGPRVSEPVRLHVAAKRYLCTTESDYYDKLAADSRISLELQGGLMSADELKQFESNEHYLYGVELRRIDDQAKVPDWQVPTLDSYLDMAGKVATN